MFFCGHCKTGAKAQAQKSKKAVEKHIEAKHRKNESGKVNQVTLDDETEEEFNLKLRKNEYKISKWAYQTAKLWGEEVGERVTII